MRAMKFRAWHKPSSAMMMVHTLHWNGNGECIGGYCHDDEWNEIAFDVTHTIIMQFTGLLDRNGKEIYEGDIIKLCGNNNGFLRVEFKNQYVGGWVLTYDGCHDLSLGARVSCEIEVIGNIYENPELAGGTQKGLDLEG